MGRRAKASSVEAPGQDSFLDVVANLVGIFLILIIIVGSQAKTAVDEARAKASLPPTDRAEPGNPEGDKLLQSLHVARGQAQEVTRDMEKLQAKLQSSQFELAYRRKELEQSAIQIQLAKEQLAREQSRMGDSEKRSIEAQVELKSLQEKLVSLEADLAEAANAKPNVEVIENLPSPKARKTSINEIEFRLKGGRLMHVPMMAIQKDVMRDMERAAGELRNRNEIMRSIGPIRGFRVHYRIYLEDKQVVAANGNSGVLRKPEADLRLEPVDDAGGELVDDALANGSEMFRQLAEHPPSTATVTLWVYPDSFVHFRKLRDSLYKKGYLVAARPLPEGQPIGASTKGERSAGQ